MPSINPSGENKGFQAAQEASADYLLEQKIFKKTKKSQAKETPQATREDERVMQSMNAAIQKWDSAVRTALEDLYETGQDIGAEVDTLRATMHTLALFEEAGNNDIVLNGQDATDFIISMNYLGLADEVKVQSCSIVFYNDSSGAPAITSYNQTGATAAAIGKEIKNQEANGWKIQSINITIYSANSATNTATGYIRTWMENTVPDAYSTTMNEVAGLKNQQTKELFRLMTAFNFKNANIEAATNLLEKLKRMTLDIFSRFS